MARLDDIAENDQAPVLESAADKRPEVVTPTVAPFEGAAHPLPALRPTPPIWKRLVLRIALALIAIAAVAGGGGYYWWRQSLERLPAGIVSGNGRIEADQIDISTKFAGRVATLRVDEGDMVKSGQVMARMDTKDLEASLKRAEAQVQLSQRAIEESRALLVQQETQVALAKQQLDRTTALARQGNATQELLDQRRQQLNASIALLTALTARVAQAENALAASRQDVELYNINITDNTLVAPRDGRIQYRIANVGEVLPAGGKVFTMIDILSVYMDIFLPTLEAGLVKIGTDARIVLDAYPDLVIPAKVSFIATKSQFTPKTVETRTERDRLMFRVRVRIDPDLLRAHAEAVRSGLPGIAYVRLDPNAEWPGRLQKTIAQ
jgi:HlyD family secretion protein